MAFTYSDNDPSSNRDQVRLLIQDIDGSQLSGDRRDWSYFFTDGEVDRFLTMAGSDVNLAASKACLALAGSTLHQEKAVKLGLFETKTKVKEEWLAMAERFRTEAEMDGGADTAEMGWTDDAISQIEENKALRSEDN